LIASSVLQTQVLAARHRAPASLATILNKQHWALEALRRSAPKRSARTQSLVLLNPGTFQAQMACSTEGVHPHLYSRDAGLYDVHCETHDDDG
jgi:hypothetical protein